MKCFLALATIALILHVGAADAASEHPCAKEARGKAEALLKYHFGEGWQKLRIGIDDDVTGVGSVKALKGRGRFDVLQVWGHVYKGDYRIRLIYASINRECVLMGQEILEASDPF
jgi:hypothetical protein